MPETVAIYYKRQIAYHESMIEHLAFSRLNWSVRLADNPSKREVALKRMDENIKSHQGKVERYQGVLADWIQS